MKKRVPAKRMYLSEIGEGFFVKNEGDFEPNYLLSPFGEKVFRAKIVATIVAGPYHSDDNSYARILIDDSSAVVWASAFREKAALFKKLSTGDIVQLIGKPHEWQDTKQLTVEAISKVEPQMMLLARAETLLRYLRFMKKSTEARTLLQDVGDVRNAIDEAPERGIDPDLINGLDELDYILGKQEEDSVDVQKLEIVKKKILETLEMLQDGESGVDLDVLIAELDPDFTSAEVEEGVRSLLSVGDIFEPSVGRYMIA
ncbi:MAG: replication protein RepA [Candidatus Methanofastidiosa archaeon]|nr:replication protein RepA [Candidatus Methanofastidiosa archaeon]